MRFGPANETAAIIATCKGRLDHFKETLQSKLTQEAPLDFIVVVVDYGDPDDSFGWAANQGIVGVKVLDDTEYFNLARARNFGVRALEGVADILCFVDSDTFLAEGWLEQVAVPLMLGMADYMYCRVPSGSLNGNCSVSRSLFERVCGYDERFQGYGFEDVDFYDRCDAAGGKFGFFEPALLTTIDHPAEDRVRFYKNKVLNADGSPANSAINYDLMQNKPAMVNPNGYAQGRFEVVGIPNR